MFFPTSITTNLFNIHFMAIQSVYQLWMNTALKRLQCTPYASVFMVIILTPFSMETEFLLRYGGNCADL